MTNSNIKTIWTDDIDDEAIDESTLDLWVEGSSKKRNSFLNPTSEEAETELEIMQLLSKLDKECSELFFNKKNK